MSSNNKHTEEILKLFRDNGYEDDAVYDLIQSHISQQSTDNETKDKSIEQMALKVYPIDITKDKEFEDGKYTIPEYDENEDARNCWIEGYKANTVNKELMLTLESLTPGGSEYVGDYKRCAAHIKELVASIPKTILPFKRENDRLRESNKELLSGLFDALHILINSPNTWQYGDDIKTIQTILKKNEQLNQ